MLWRCKLKIDRCDQVIVIPDDKRIIVFNDGNAHGSKEKTSTGGQISPINTDIIKVLWKKLQKKEIKYTDTMDIIFGHLLGYSDDDIQGFIGFCARNNSQTRL